MPKPFYRAVIISPHLDDAVFSCGGTIDALVKEGPVLVLNIFTRYLSDVKFHGIAMGDERLQEEKDAAKFLGYESRNLDELDAIYRQKAYQKISNIFRPVVEEDLQWLPTLRDKVFAILNTVDFQQIYVPLGIGWHVDHLMTHQIFEPWFGNEDLIFYEDLPYATIPHTTRYRLNELADYAKEPKDKSLAPMNEFLAWRQTSHAYGQTALMKNLKPWFVRLGAVPAVSFYLYRLLSLHRRHAKNTKKIPLKPQVNFINKQFDRKVDAMALYGTQFREFFFSKESCGENLKSYAKQMQCGGEMVERFWKQNTGNKI